MRNQAVIPYTCSREEGCWIVVHCSSAELSSHSGSPGSRIVELTKKPRMRPVRKSGGVVWKYMMMKTYDNNFAKE